MLVRACQYNREHNNETKKNMTNKTTWCWGQPTFIVGYCVELLLFLCAKMHVCVSENEWGSN